MKTMSKNSKVFLKIAGLIFVIGVTSAILINNIGHKKEEEKESVEAYTNIDEQAETEQKETEKEENIIMEDPFYYGDWHYYGYGAYYIISISERRFDVGIVDSEYLSLGTIKKTEILSDDTVKLYVDNDYLDGTKEETEVILQKTGENTMTIKSEVSELRVSRK